MYPALELQLMPNSCAGKVIAVLALLTSAWTAPQQFQSSISTKLNSKMGKNRTNRNIIFLGTGQQTTTRIVTKSHLTHYILSFPQRNIVLANPPATAIPVINKNKIWEVIFLSLEFDKNVAIFGFVDSVTSTFLSASGSLQIVG